MNNPPKKLKRVPLKEELAALTGDFIKALILQQFLYWGERVSDFDDFVAEEKERRPELELEMRHGWIYKSTEQLHDELMFGDSLSPRTVKRRLDEIVKSGWLSSRNNPDHKWDRCLQYRPNIIKIQVDLQKMGYALEGYPLFIPSLPFDTVSNADVTMTNRMDVETNQTVASVQAIPETTTETTTESLKASSANADYSLPVSLLTIKEIKSLKLYAPEWQQYLEDEQAEKKRPGVIDFIEKKLAKRLLMPDTPASLLLFKKITIEYDAKGRRPPETFPTLAIKEKFDQAAVRLNGTLEKAIQTGIENVGIAIPKLVNYVASPKWQQGKKSGQQSKGSARTGQPKAYGNQGSSQKTNFAPPAGSGQSAETAARLRAAFAPKL